MKTIPKLLMITSLFLCFIACKKDNTETFSIDCEHLLTAMSQDNDSIVIAEINTLVEDLTPEPISGDELGHAENLDQLTGRLEEACKNLEVSIVCYACIETYPLQSEIKIEGEVSGSTVVRIIDILTPEDGTLKAIGMHQ